MNVDKDFGPVHRVDFMRMLMASAHVEAAVIYCRVYNPKRQPDCRTLLATPRWRSQHHFLLPDSTALISISF